MAYTGPISGAGGSATLGTVLTDVDVTKWSYNPKANNQEYGSNKTQGGTNRIWGGTDFSGSISVKLNGGAKLAITIGGAYNNGAPTTTYYDLTLVSATGVTIFDSTTDNAQVIIDDVSYEVDIESKAIVGAEIKFSRGKPKS